MSINRALQNKMAQPESNQGHPYQPVLCQASEEEYAEIAKSTASSWSESFTLSAHLEDAKFMRTAPLARNNGLTTWILTEDQKAPGERLIFASCETFRKRALVSDAHGEVNEAIVHAIGSVFTPIEHRGHGYAKKLMLDLAKRLQNWQIDNKRYLGSILYSDIGKKYYANLGWRPNPSNFHVEFQPQAMEWPTSAKALEVQDLPALCERDEIMLRSILAVPSETTHLRMTICPDEEQLGWHRAKEEFACRFHFNKVPQAQGASAGQQGSRVWATWTRRYYSPPGSQLAGNVLYILRLVVEGDPSATRLASDAQKTPRTEVYEEQTRNLDAVLKAARAEASVWNLDVVKLWDPTPLARRILVDLGMDHKSIEREEKSIASGFWYANEGEMETAPLWVNNEHYAWL